MVSTTAGSSERGGGREQWRERERREGEEKVRGRERESSKCSHADLFNQTTSLMTNLSV